MYDPLTMIAAAVVCRSVWDVLQGMVCVLEESDTMCQCAVRDMRKTSDSATDTTTLFQMPGSTNVSEFLQMVASRFKSESKNIKLTYTPSSGLDVSFTSRFWF